MSKEPLRNPFFPQSGSFILGALCVFNSSLLQSTILANSVQSPLKTLEQQHQFVFAVKHLGLRSKSEYETMDLNFNFQFLVFTTKCV